MIQQDQELIKRDVLLPWMKNSVSYQAVFPELFIKLNLKGEKIKSTILFDEIYSLYKEENIVFTGNAGCGKSTLLRYLYLFENKNKELLYLKATVIQCEDSLLTPYQKCVLAYLKGTVKSKYHKIICLDGMDEVLSDSLNDLIQLILKKPKNITIWMGWRTEYYYQCETDELRQFITNVLSLPKWELKTAKDFVQCYANKTMQPALFPDFEEIIRNNDTIQEFTESPFHLTLLVYLLENPPEDNWYKKSQNWSIYELYHQFFLCWLTKENKRKGLNLSKEDARKQLWPIAYSLYYGEHYPIESESTIITDLLIFSSLLKDGKKVAVDFYHKNLCDFFLADAIFYALQCGEYPLIQALNRPLRNDITDFVRSAINTMSKQEEIKELQNHLMNTYRQIIFPEQEILSSNTKQKLFKLQEENLFYLKNELIYLLTRISKPSEDIAAFIKQAYNYEKNPYMKLDIAYGAVLTGPSEIALEYAKSLVPGSESDMINRSWTVAFFGDVQCNPYNYQDIEKSVTVHSLA